jgi:hypothetical protein
MIFSLIYVETWKKFVVMNFETSNSEAPLTMME